MDLRLLLRRTRQFHYNHSACLYFGRSVRDRAAEKQEDLRTRLIENAAEINRLHSHVHEAFKLRTKNEESQQEWSRACQEFRARYEQLCLPGGWDSGFYGRILAGDIETIEVALCFLEVRPYFFRSGYHWKAILQKCKRAPMVGEQAERFAILLVKHDAWKQRKSKRAANRH
jgi:hypothetical protein